MIPLYQIQSVTNISSNQNAEDMNNASGSLLPHLRGPMRKLVDEFAAPEQQSISHFHALIQIQTAPDGLNSGRTYYIYHPSEQHRQALVKDLSSISKLAASRRIAVSRFMASQAAVR